MKPTALSIEGLREAVSRLPDNALTATRQAALANLHENGMPTARDEDWKYTDLGSAIDISNRWLSHGAAAVSTDTLAESIALLTASIDANWLVVANGLIDLSHFIETAGIEVEQFSNSAAPIVSDRPLADLNAALLNDGLRVQINAATEKPLGMLIIDEANDGAAVSQVNIEIEVTAGCDAEIIEYHTSSGDDDHYGNSVVALQIGQAAATREATAGHRDLNRAIDERRDIEPDLTSVKSRVLRRVAEQDLVANGLRRQSHEAFEDLAEDVAEVCGRLQIAFLTGSRLDVQLARAETRPVTTRRGQARTRAAIRYMAD